MGLQCGQRLTKHNQPTTPCPLRDRLLGQYDQFIGALLKSCLHATTQLAEFLQQVQ